MAFNPFFFKESTKCLRIISIIGHKLFWWQTSNPWDMGTKDFICDGKEEYLFLILVSFLLMSGQIIS